LRTAGITRWSTALRSPRNPALTGSLPTAGTGGGGTAPVPSCGTGETGLTTTGAGLGFGALGNGLSGVLSSSAPCDHVVIVEGRMIATPRGSPSGPYSGRGSKPTSASRWLFVSGRFRAD